MSLPRSSPRTPRAIWHIVALALLGLAPGCGEQADSPVPDVRAQDPTGQRLERLIELFTPLEKTVTSDITDRRFLDSQQLLAELCAAGPTVGNRALALLRQDKGRKYPQEVERALLRVAARAAPQDSRVLLENLVTQYGTDLGLRTEATLLLAEVHPARALEILQPYVCKARQSQTLPPSEFLVRAWVLACEKGGTSPVPAMVDVATNLFMEEAARVRAVRELGRHPGDPLAEKGISAVLIESTGNGYLRRVATQSLLALLPRESACRLLTQVADREADLNMLAFLRDVLDKNCRQ